MSQISDKLNSLEKLVSENESKLSKKISITSIFFFLFAIGVTAYSFALISKIKKWTSAEVTSEILVGMITEQASEARVNTTQHLQDNAESMASAIVEQSINAIPKTQETLVGAMDNLIDYVANEIETVFLPEFTKTLQENSGELREHYKDFSEEEKMQALTLILVEMLEAEMDKYINEAIISETFALKKQILELNKPANELTKKEFAQKKVLANWVYLTKNHDIGNSVIMDFVYRIKDEFNTVLEVQQEEDEDLESLGFSTAQEL